MMGWIEPTVMSELFTGFVDLVLFKATIIVACAAYASHVVRRSSASVRHGIWAATLLVLVALPAMRFAAPEPVVTMVGVRPSVERAIAKRATSDRLSSPAPELAVPGLDVSTASAPLDQVRRPLTTVGASPFEQWVVTIWLAGLALHLGLLAFRVRSAHRLARTADPCPAWVQRRVEEIAAGIGLAHSPRTVLTREASLPGTFGVLRPIVLLPHDVHSWSPHRTDAALLHELAHLRRGDYLTYLLAALVKAAYWINPIVWYADRRLDIERERACDDGVVKDRVDPVSYAEYLMNLAGRGRSVGGQPILSLVTRSSLAERVKSLLDPAQVRKPLGRVALLGIGGGALLAGLSVGAVQLLAVVQDPEVARLADSDPAVRTRAAWSMGESERRSHVMPLTQSLHDPEWKVRAVAAWALGEIKDPQAVEPLANLLADSNARVREMAVLAIGEIEDRSGLAPLRSAPTGVAPPEALRWATAQIESGQNDADVFVGGLEHPTVRIVDLPSYVGELDSPDPRRRARAAEQLGLLGLVEGVEPLLSLLDDPEPAVRAVAIWALDEINPTSASGRSVN